MSLQTFDYESAWSALAYPGWLKLNPHTRAVLERAAIATRDSVQNAQLDTTWPADPGVCAALEGLSSEQLAAGARIIHALEQWHWSGAEWKAEWMAWGGGWKVANLCDQLLRGRLELPRDWKGPGMGLYVLEGMIRLAYAWQDGWTWREVAPATEEGLKVAKGMLRGSFAGATMRERHEAGERYVQGLPEWRPAEWDTSRYMVPVDVFRQRQGGERARRNHPQG